MQLGDQRASGNVEDRRGIGVGGGLGVGGIVIALVAYFLGFDPSTVINVAEQVGARSAKRAKRPRARPRTRRDSSSPRSSAAPRTSGRRSSSSPRQPVSPADARPLRRSRCARPAAWGRRRWARSTVPNDEKLYLDLSFFRDLQTRFQAPGDFAQAYVIAHEVGHHVQKLTGAFEQMEAARGRGSQADANQNSVRMELQADCYAGVWGHHAGTMKQLDAGDIAEALNAATAIGDDRLQKQTQGRVVPDRSRTARRSSACAGSSAAWIRAARRTATRSRPARSEAPFEYQTILVDRRRPAGLVRKREFIWM